MQCEGMQWQPLQVIAVNLKRRAISYQIFNFSSLSAPVPLQNQLEVSDTEVFYARSPCRRPPSSLAVAVAVRPPFCCTSGSRLGPSSRSIFAYLRWLGQKCRIWKESQILGELIATAVRAPASDLRRTRTRKWRRFECHGKAKIKGRSVTSHLGLLANQNHDPNNNLM